ncbi:hypothetical protein GCM10022284_56060 [Streptomyces hundungensis]
MDSGEGAGLEALGRETGRLTVAHTREQLSQGRQRSFPFHCRTASREDQGAQGHGRALRLPQECALAVSRRPFDQYDSRAPLQGIDDDCLESLTSSLEFRNCHTVPRLF